MAKSELSQSEVRTLLQTALSTGKSKSTYIWIRDIFPSSIVWSEETEYGATATLYQASYTIDKDKKVTLDKPQQVIAKAVYEPVAKAAVYTLGVLAFSKGKEVTKEGKIFEVGEFPDKEFSLTEEEMAAAIAEFEPVDIDYEHVDGPLSGKLGQLLEVWSDDTGKELLGRISIPAWLNDALGKVPLKVSTTWDKVTKRLVGLALVNRPRIPDAALMAAFAGSRHSKADLADLQSMHDILVKHGVSCATKEKEAKMARTNKSFLDLLADRIGQTLLGRTAPPEEEGESASGEGDEATVINVFAPKAEMKAESEEMKALRQMLAQERAARITDAAIAFVDGLIGKNLAYPAEREGLIAQFTQAAQDDVLHPSKVSFSRDGSTVEGSRVDAFKAVCMLRTPHILTKELVEVGEGDQKQQVLMSGAEKNGQPSPSRLEALKNMTPLGRTVKEK